MIVDEIHELAESKRGVQLSLNLEKLKFIINRNLQIIGLSATVGSPDKVAKLLVGANGECEIVYVPVAKRMKLKVFYPEVTEKDRDLAEQIYTFPEVAARLRRIRDLLNKYGASLIFTNTRPTAEALTSRFKIWDFKFPIGVHHGSLSVIPRVRAEKGIKSGKLKGIVATSSLELGLDIGRVDVCIQYGSPRQVTKLIQRVGRSGHRIEEISRGVIIAQNSDDALESLVIAKRALSEKLEEITIFNKPLDVLAHFIAGLLIFNPTWTLDTILEIVKNSYPYKDLKEDELKGLLSFLHSLSQRFIAFFEEDKVVKRSSRRGRIFSYFHENLSMIPEVRQYLVINEEDGLPIGVLDESFIAEYGEIGVKFVMAGEVWRIVQIFKDRVYVKPELDPEGAIPSWVGEEIPVPFEIAQEVGKIRGIVEDLAFKGLSLEGIGKSLSKIYPASKEVMIKALKDVWAHIKMGFPVPRDNLILIEKWEDYIIIHAHFGTKVNRTLARYLAERISREMGLTVGVHEDPYRIFIKGRELLPEDLIRAFKYTSGDLIDIIKETARRTKFFRYRIGHVARRMGIITKKTELSLQLIDQLIKAFSGTPLHEETLNEVLTKDLDLNLTAYVLNKLRKGDIRITSIGEVSKPTPLASLGLKWIYGRPEYVSPDRARILAIASTRARLLSEIITVLCMNCKAFVRELPVYELIEGELKCPLCSSNKIAILKESEEDVLNFLYKEKTGKTQGEFWRKAVKSAELILKYGKPAVLVQVARGIDLKKAEEIVLTEKRITGRLFELIARAEKEALLKSHLPKV